MAPMRRVVLVALVVAFLAPAALAQNQGAAVKGEILMWISDAEEKLLALAEATPADKYGWAPAEGVRTNAQVFMHVASANYGIPSFWGVAPPAGYKMETYEGSITAKADVQKALKESFAHVKKAIESADDATMSKQLEFFGLKTTVRGAFLLLLSHSHEHLGQAIAYARTNGITPPWSKPMPADHKH